MAVSLTFELVYKNLNDSAILTGVYIPSSKSTHVKPNGEPAAKAKVPVMIIIHGKSVPSG